jgi:hypothetical protein
VTSTAEAETAARRGGAAAGGQRRRDVGQQRQAASVTKKKTRDLSGFKQKERGRGPRGSENFFLDVGLEGNEHLQEHHQEHPSKHLKNVY